MMEFVEFIFGDFWRWLAFTITLVLSIAYFRPVVVAETYETWGVWE